MPGGQQPKILDATRLHGVGQLNLASQDIGRTDFAASMKQTMNRRPPQIGIEQQHTLARLSQCDCQVGEERRFAVAWFGATDLNHFLFRIEPHEKGGANRAVRFRFGRAGSMEVAQRRLQRDVRIDVAEMNVELRHTAEHWSSSDQLADV